MGVLIDLTKAFLDSKGLNYRETNDGKVLRLGFSGLKNKGSIENVVIFDDNDRTISIKSFNLCVVPEEKKAAVYEACSKLNNDYRWVKFFIDESDNTVTVQDDAVVSPDTVGEEIHELIARMNSITDQAYPVLMKALWA